MRQPAVVGKREPHHRRQAERAGLLRLLEHEHGRLHVGHRRLRHLPGFLGFLRAPERAAPPPSARERDHQEAGAQPFVHAHGNPHAHDAPAHADAQHVSAGHGEYPRRDNVHGHRRFHVAHRDERFHHDDIECAPDAEEDFHQQHLTAQLVHHRVGREQAEHGIGVEPDERRYARGKRDGDEVGHPHPARHRVELAGAEQISQHDLRRLRQRDGIQVRDTRDHRAIHLHRHHRRAQHVDERQDDDLRHVVVHLLARRRDTHAQHALERDPGKRPQIPQTHAHVGVFQHETARHHEAHDARHHVRDRGPFHAERRHERDTADERRTRRDIHGIHHEARLHDVRTARVAAQQRREREERSLHHRRRSNDQQKRRCHTGDGPVDVEPREELRPEDEQHGGHHGRQADVHHEGHRRDFRHRTRGGRISQHTRDEHGRGRAHGRERNGDDVEYLQGIAHRGSRVGAEGSEHELVDVPDHNLHEQFNEQRNGKHEHVARRGLLRRCAAGTVATRRACAFRRIACFRGQASCMRGSQMVHGFSIPLSVQRLRAVQYTAR